MKAIVTILALSATPAAFAQHAGDVYLAQEAGRIATGASTGGAPVLGERVFVSELGLAFPNFTDSPGFDTLPDAFPPNSNIGFRIRAAMREWSGSAFDVIPDERMELAFGPLGPVLTPTSDQVVEGFTIRVGSNGQWHRHLEYTLGEPADSGIYLVEMELFSSVPGIGDSEPIWIVFNQGRSEGEVTAAAEWVRDALASCRADFDGDGFVDFFDFDAFAGCFEGGGCPDGRSADFDGDGFVDFFDFDAFVAAFEQGCS